MSGYFSNIFAKSPIDPLKEHMSTAQECIEILEPFFVAVCKGDFDKAEALQQKISATEIKADELKKSLRIHLPRSMFMPVSRADVLNLLLMQDKIANKTKDIAGTVLGRKIHFPKVIQKDYMSLIKKSIEASAQAKNAIFELDKLVEVGFRGGEVKLVQKLLKKLDKIEHSTDQLEKVVRQSLFGIEKDLPPIDAMFLYKIIDATGDLGDAAQRVGSRLQVMLAR